MIVIAVLVLYFLGGSRVGKTFDVEVAAVVVPSGPEAVERGKHYADAIGLCSGCHGDRLEGDILAEDALLGTLAAPNLTPGLGGIVGDYTDLDFVRTIRHGVKPDGKSVVIMPSQYFNGISDDDLGAVIAYIKSLPPVDNEVPETSLGPLGRIITLLDPALLPAREIDHTAAREPVPEPGVTAAYGGYLAIVCTVCHGDSLSGGTVPGEDADAPVARNLTPGGALASWTEADFAHLLRTGQTPAGEQLDEEFMPWDHFKLLTEDEIEALWLFVSALPAREYGE